MKKKLPILVACAFALLVVGGVVVKQSIAKSEAIKMEQAEKGKS